MPVNPFGNSGNRGVSIAKLKEVVKNLIKDIKQGPPVRDSTVPGPKGNKGDPGKDSTVPGPKGDKGDPGKDSIVPGPKGDKGDPGKQGPKGEIELQNGYQFDGEYFDEASEGHTSGLVTFEGKTRLASYGTWSLELESLSNQKLIFDNMFLFSIHKYQPTSFDEECCYIMPGDVYIRSILITTATARSKSEGMCDVYICSGDLNAETYKQRCIIKKAYTNRETRTVQAVPDGNLVLKAGENIFFLWSFDTVHPIEFKPKLVKIRIEGSMLAPPGNSNQVWPQVGGYVPD